LCHRLLEKYIKLCCNNSNDTTSDSNSSNNNNRSLNINYISNCSSDEFPVYNALDFESSNFTKLEVDRIGSSDIALASSHNNEKKKVCTAVGCGKLNRTIAKRCGICKSEFLPPKCICGIEFVDNDYPNCDQCGHANPFYREG